MIPFEDYAAEGDTIYLAVQAKYADRLVTIAKSEVPFKEFRLLLLVFGDRLEFLHLCDASTIVDLPDIVAMKNRDGNWLDPVIGVVLADHMAVRKRETPLLFVFSDGDVKTDWYKGLLPQVVKFVWLNEPTTEPLLTPFGERREVVFAAEAWGTEATVPVAVPVAVRDNREPSRQLVQRDAMHHSADHPGGHMEAVLSRVSAEVTKHALERRATCVLCRKPQRRGCTNGVMADGSDCPDRLQKTH